MKLHTKYQRPGPSGFRQEDLLSFQLKIYFSSCDLDVKKDRSYLNPISSLGGDVVWKNVYGRTDAGPDARTTDDGQNVITNAHLFIMWQGELT